jgi:hypothetical protein
VFIKYESAAQKLLLSVETILHNSKQFQHARLSYVQAVFNYPRSALQHSRGNCFDGSNSSKLQFIEGGHKDLVAV